MAFPTGYTKYQEVTIDNTKVTADQTDFVVYVDLSDMDTTTDIFDTCRTDGGDIRVTKTDGTTELAREVVSIDTTAKTGEIHLKYTGTLSSSADTVIRIWYNGTDTEPASSATYGSEPVWSDYELVQHMNEASGNISDSTANGRTGTAVGNPTYDQTGQIAESIAFDGTGDWFYTADSALGFNTGYTVQAWVKATTPSATYSIVGRDDGGSGGNQELQFRLDTTTGYLRFIPFNTSTATIANLAGTTDCADGSLHKVDATYHTTNGSEVFVDSSTDGTDSNTDTHKNLSMATDIGVRDSQNDLHDPYIGDIDEVRITTAPLASTWIATEYNNQDSPSTFYSVGTEQGGGGGAITYNALAMSNF